MPSSGTDRTNLREAIITASLQIGSELGEEGLTMRGLAGRLGVSPTALYQYFEGKAAILREIRLHGLSRLIESIMHALQSGTPREFMLAASRRYLEFARENPWLYKVLFESPEAPDTVLTQEQLAMLRKHQDRLAAVNAELFSQLALRGDDVLPKFVASWWCSLHGLCSLTLGGRLNARDPVVPICDVDSFAGEYIEALVDGLLGRIGE